MSGPPKLPNVSVPKIEIPKLPGKDAARDLVQPVANAAGALQPQVKDIKAEEDRVERVRNFLDSFGRNASRTPGRSALLLGANDQTEFQLLTQKTKV